MTKKEIKKRIETLEKDLKKAENHLKSCDYDVETETWQEYGFIMGKLEGFIEATK